MQSKEQQEAMEKYLAKERAEAAEYAKLLKVGDTFILTKKMAEAKSNGQTNTAEVIDKVGKRVTIKEIRDDHYEVRVGGEDYNFNFDLFDQPPQSNQSAKRIWKTEFKSSDGIEIRDGEVSIDIEVKRHTAYASIFTPEQLTTLANQIRAAKLQLKKLKS